MLVMTASVVESAVLPIARIATAMIGILCARVVVMVVMVVSASMRTMLR